MDCHWVTRLTECQHEGTTTRALEVMSDDLKNAIQKKREETVGNGTGYKDYQELKRSFRKQTPLI